MTLGILGGMGPAATAHFYSRLISLTDAEGDGGHLDVLLSGRASTPDRTAYLLGESGESPLPSLLQDAERLAAAGADLLVMLCHTAHAFLPELRAALRLPLLDMPYIALAAAAQRGWRRIGVLSTEGSFRASVFEAPASRCGISLLYPTGEERRRVSDIIYKAVKCGKPDPCVAKIPLAPSLSTQICDALLLGCTELSLLHPLDLRTGNAFYRLPYIDQERVYIDPLEILCRVCIRLAGKKLREERTDALS